MRTRLFLLDLSRGNEPSFNLSKLATSICKDRSYENLYEAETIERTE